MSPITFFRKLGSDPQLRQRVMSDAFLARMASTMRFLTVVTAPAVAASCIR